MHHSRPFNYPEIALIFAVKNNYPEIAQELIRAGAALDLQDRTRGASTSLIRTGEFLNQ